MLFKEWSDNQRRVFTDTVQVYEAFSDAFRRMTSYRGGMHWKNVKGKEYLFKTVDRYGNGKSLGARSPETEKILAEFQQNKLEIKERLDSLKARLAEQSRFCKAALIQRAPRTAASVLRILDQENILGKNVLVIGTYAMFAYETAAGVYFDNPLLATGDMDIIWDIRPRLKLIGDNAIRDKGFMGILKKADRSFELMHKSGFRVVNKNGFMVDLVKAEPRDLRISEPRRMGKEGDLEAAEIRNLQWLTASPKIFQVIIGDDGYPAPIAAPDPRAFALHKIWLSKQSDRDPVKKQRDNHQGIATAKLVIKYLPQYSFKLSELRMFPKQVLETAKQTFSNENMPAGFDVDEEII